MSLLKMKHDLVKISALMLLLAVMPVSAWAKDWTIEVVGLDGVDLQDGAAVPLQEAIKFIQDRTPLTIKVHVMGSSVAHNYTYWPCKVKNADARCVTVNVTNIDPAFIRSLPNASSYLFLYRVGDNKPLQAGSTLGPEFSHLTVNGMRKPVSSIPVDVWWYNNKPFEGFNSHIAQLMTHEIVNGINTVLVDSPYHCAPLTPDDPTTTGSVFESSRLAKLTHSCYQSYIRKD